MRSRSDRQTDAIRRAAHAWHVRRVSEGLSPRESARLRQWLDADPRHREALDRAARLWTALGELRPADVPAASLRPLPAEKAVSWLGAGWRSWSVRLAGSAVLAAIVLVALPPGVFDLSSTHHRADTAEIREVALADGSVVTLGPQAHIATTFSREARHVDLLSGEAFFSVASDPNRPFVVSVGETDVSVVGTAFALRRLAEGLRLGVVEGAVDVRQPDDTRDKPLAQLRAGEQILVTARGGASSVEIVDPADLGAWRNGRLVYRGARLSEVIADANRYSTTWFVLSDDAAASLAITASFDAGDIDGMISALADALPISVWRPIAAVAVIGTTQPTASP
ncbi:MAG: FecR domain-containing protein [Pseudomonadota bacterium]